MQECTERSIDLSEWRFTMRHYPSNSPEAMARIIALALLADGAIDLSELESMKHLDITKDLGLNDRQFDKVIHDFCDDMMTFAHRSPAGQLELDQKSICLARRDSRSGVAKPTPERDAAYRQCRGKTIGQ